MNRRTLSAQSLAPEHPAGSAPAAGPRFEQVESPAEVAWARLADRLRAGDPEAPSAFTETYRRGVRLLFRRYVGAIGVDQIVDEALAGVVDGVRSGSIADPAGMVRFVREIMSRHQRERQPGAAPLRAAPAVAQGVSETLRRRQKAALLEQALRQFNPAERRALKSYYVEGQDIAALLAAAGLSRQMRPHTRQARQTIFQLSQFHLQLALARLGMLGKDIENKRRTIEDFDLLTKS